MRATLAMLLVALAFSGCSVRVGGSGASKVARVGQQAPDWTQPTSSGGKLSLSSLRGKAVYLNFFATWCPPCNEEAPFINSLQKQYAGQGLQVIGVDELENQQKAQSFIRKYGLSYPAVVDDGTASDRNMRSTAYPFTSLSIAAASSKRLSSAKWTRARSSARFTQLFDCFYEALHCGFC